MADLKVRHLVVGAVATNCYITENKKTKEALIIDPGDNAARIVQIIKEDGVVPVAVLLTHGHFDHAMAAQEVAEQYGIKSMLMRRKRRPWRHRRSIYPE